MTAPLSVNAVTDVEINDSCNCCLPFRRKNKHKEIDKKTEEVFERHVPKEIHNHNHHHQHKDKK